MRDSSDLALPVRALLWILAALPAMWGCAQKSAPPAPAPPEVSVVKLTAMPVTLFEEYVGQTEAVDTVEIRARVGGILERQAFEDGARVKKGDVLFVLDQQPYIAALEQAKATLAQAQASYLNSKQNLARAQPLSAEQAISQQDLDAAIAKERSDAANVEAAKAQVRQAELNLGYTTIRAPRDGDMSKALIKPGGLVNASSTLLTTLYSVDPLYVNFTISEQKLGELQKQLKVNPRDHNNSKAAPFTLKLIDGTEYKHRGRLSFVDAAVDAKSGTLQARVTVPNPERALRPGQFVRVVVPAGENANAVRVPQKAVQELQGKQSVFVIGPDNKVVYRDIIAKTRIGQDWLVENGLNPGELVVVEGVQKAKAGAAVKAVVLSPEQAPAATTKPVQDTRPVQGGKAGG